MTTPSASDTRLTVRQLFGLQDVELSAEATERIAQRETYTQIQAQLQEKAGAAWASIARRLPEQLDTLLDIDVVAMLVGAWNKSRELRNVP